MSTELDRMLPHYQRLLAELQNGIAQAQSQQTGALWIMGAAILFCGLVFLPSIRRGVPAWYPPLALPVAAVYGRKYLQHRRTAFRNSRMARFYSRGVQRLNGTWAGSGDSGEQFTCPGHVYQHDLHVLGKGSLFELLCTARTQLGRAKLAEYLLNLPDVTESRARQEAVKELAPRRELREAVHLLGAFDFQGRGQGAMQDWLTEAPVRASLPVRILMACCSVLLGILLLAIFAHAAPLAGAMPFLAALGAMQLLLASVWSRRTRPVLKSVRGFGRDIEILREGLQVLQREPFASAKLAALAAVIGNDAPARLRKLERLVNGVRQCETEWFYGPSRLLLAHIQLALAIEQWKYEHGDDLQRWAGAWAEFEALNCLGCYAYEHAADVFPTLVDERPILQVKGLGHPLLREDKCVRNEADLGPARRFYLVSGSNMAGKSTFLRAIGTNAVLASIGAPIRAVSGTMSGFSVCASISTSDSLSEGKSRFLAEVERLRETMRMASGPKPVLFLMDEIFSGTNSTDRRVAAEAVVVELVRAGAVGALSTHDLTLTQIAERPELAGENVHMASNGPDDPLAFDYRVRPGICTQSNALAIVKLAGIHVG